MHLLVDFLVAALVAVVAYILLDTTPELAVIIGLLGLIIYHLLDIKEVIE